MAERKSFVVYQDWKKLFKRLSREQKGDVFDAMFEYQESGRPYDGGDAVVGVAFDAMQIVFDRDNEKYREQCRRSAENGKKGGRPRKSAPAEEAPLTETDGSDELPPELPAEPKKPGGFSENPPKPKKADNENASDNDNDNDTDNGNGNENDNDTVCSAAAGPAPAGPEAAAGQKEILSWLADRCQAVTGIVPNPAQQKILAEWYRKHGEDTMERLFSEARDHSAQRFGYFSAIMRRWEKTGVPSGQAGNRPRRGPEPRRKPSPEEAARQQAALAENQRQLEQLLADTAWMEGGLEA